MATSTAASSATTTTGRSEKSYEASRTRRRWGARCTLGIERIDALSPQAKGRVERLWGTLQDRLVSELRLAKARNVEQANAVLERFRSEHNRRFSIAAVDQTPAWRLVRARVLGLDGRYYHAFWNGGPWGPLTYLPISDTVFNGPPTVVGTGTESGLYIIGRGTNGAYYISTWDGTTFTPFDDTPFFGDVYISDPVATNFINLQNSTDTGEIDVFGVGRDWRYYHRSFNGSSWGKLEAIEGVYVGPPAVLGTQSVTRSELVVFGEGTDQGFYWSANSTGYAPWSPNILSTDDTPAASARPPGRHEARTGSL